MIILARNRYNQVMKSFKKSFNGVFFLISALIHFGVSKNNFNNLFLTMTLSIMLKLTSFTSQIAISKKSKNVQVTSTVWTVSHISSREVVASVLDCFLGRFFCQGFMWSFSEIDMFWDIRSSWSLIKRGFCKFKEPKSMGNILTVDSANVLKYF